MGLLYISLQNKKKKKKIKKGHALTWDHGVTSSIELVHKSTKFQRKRQTSHYFSC